MISGCWFVLIIDLLFRRLRIVVVAMIVRGYRVLKVIFCLWNFLCIFRIQMFMENLVSV